MAHPQPRGKGTWEERKTLKKRSMKMSSLVDLDHGLVAGQEEVSWGSRRAASTSSSDHPGIKYKLNDAAIRR
jgi:hypothetical protein